MTTTKVRLPNGSEVETTTVTGQEARKMWRRLMDEGIEPHLEKIAPILSAGKIAVIVFEPDDSVKHGIRTLGWDGKTAVFPMSNTIRKRLANSLIRLPQRGCCVITVGSIGCSFGGDSVAF